MLKKKVNKPRSIIIFDGSNFYHKLKELSLPHTKTFNYSKFTTSLTKSTKLVTKYYCVGKVKALQNDTKARLMMANQQSLVTRLKHDGFVIQFGYLLKSDGKFHEKGTDIQIATNLLADGLRDKYDICYLVTSDSDLIPAINEVQRSGKTVCYVGFKHKTSYALKRACKATMLLSKTDLLSFITLSATAST